MLLGKPFIPALRPLAEQCRALSLIHRAGKPKESLEHGGEILTTRPHPPPHCAAINGIKESLGKPKRGPNGYSLFYQEKYEEMRSQCKSKLHALLVQWGRADGVVSK